VQLQDKKVQQQLILVKQMMTEQISSHF